LTPGYQADRQTAAFGRCILAAAPANAADGVSCKSRFTDWWMAARR
jgi:hypothetical protein